MRHVTRMTIEDAEHYTPDQRAAIIASYPPHEREARTLGIPSLGSGRVFPVAEDDIRCDAIPIAAHWPQLGGMDFGWDHPFAAVAIAWDRDADIVYITRTYRVREATPIIHAAALKPWGEWMPWAWPHDGLQHDKGSGKPLAQQYREQGLKLLHGHAPIGLEAGVMEMLSRMQSGRLKVFRHLNDWFGEFRLYHRVDGRIVKEGDDLMSATRYAVTCLADYAKTKPDTTAALAGFRPSGGWMS